MDSKAQGSLEYLLLIAGAVVVAAIVIIVMGNIFTPTSHRVNESLNEFLHLT